MTKILYTLSGLQVFVSLEDYERLRKYTWCINHDGKGKLYVCRYEKDVDGKSVRIYMHREITDCPPHLVVDHINGNTLDNRRSNLRVCTKGANACNTIAWGLCRFKGVNVENRKRNKKAYRARIYDNECDVSVSLGTYCTAEEAAQAYDAAAVLLFGDFAWLNFPVNYIEKEEKQDEEIPF